MSARYFLFLACLSTLLTLSVIAQEAPPNIDVTDDGPGATMPATAPVVVPSASTPAELSKLAGTPGKAPNPGNSFRFVVIADRTGGHVGTLWEQAVDQINLLRPDFVMCVGDLIEGYSIQEEEITRQWEELEAVVARFQAPFFFCPGNHDVTNGLMREIYFNRHGKNGRSWYSFNYRNCHFIVLDSLSFAADEIVHDQQKEWLIQDCKAAANADHVFVFFHHPMPPGSELVDPIAENLDPAKVTIFNGHTHVLAYHEDRGIPVHVLSSTGAGVGRGGRELGDIRAFAHVAVNDGKPSVAIVPAGEIMPGDYVRRDFLEAFGKLVEGTVVRPSAGLNGTWSVSFEQPNPLTTPATVSATWKSQGSVDPADAAKLWGISFSGGGDPLRAEWTIAPGESIKQVFAVGPWSIDSDSPEAVKTLAAPQTLLVHYTTTNLQGRPVEYDKSFTLPARMDLVVLSRADVDGKLEEWASVQPVRVEVADKIAAEPEAWTGAKDLSFAFRAAVAGDRLAVAVDVTDDIVSVEGPSFAHKDGIKLFWDARPVERQNNLYAEQSGQVSLAVTPEDGPVQPQFSVGHQQLPKGTQAVCVRREGGYVMEMSIPLKEIGLAGGLGKGQSIRLDVQVTDRDESGEVPLTRMVAFSGRPVNNTPARLAFAVVP